jgi:hypothetical protein
MARLDEMKRFMISVLAAAGGGALTLAMKQLGENRRRSARDSAMRRLTAYAIVPVWIGAGFADYLWHRRTRIETTSGLGESASHSLLMLEAGPAVLSALFLEVNAGVLAAMIGFSVLHELTVLWDLRYTQSRRVTFAGEQLTHTFLEAPPMIVTAIAIITHWEQFLALLGRGSERPRFGLRLQKPPVPAWTVLSIFSALLLFGAVPHADELRRCIRARRAGLVEADTPECLPQVFAR